MNVNIDVMKKITQEFKDLEKNPIAEVGVSVGLVNEHNIFVWKCTLMGPNDSIYSGGLFYLIIKFPEDYPKKPPEVCFETPIYHVNINPRKSGSESLGHVCISTLNWWNEKTKMREVLTNIFGLFYMHNPDSPYGLDRAEEYKTKRELYDEKARFFTKKYADIKLDKRIVFDEKWDFTYP